MGIMIGIKFPAVMGILNITPDSFYDGGYYQVLAGQLKHVEKMLNEGASIIDIGAVSTRPGAKSVTEEEELERLLPVLDAVKMKFPDSIVSVDTFRSSVARIAIEHGASIINDIYGGRFDGKMITTVVEKNVPVILMHMQGTPETMQVEPHYKDVVEEVDEFFRKRVSLFPPGYPGILLDPGFGFGKTVEHNYLLLAHLDRFRKHGYPVVTGLSRKSMINAVLKSKPSDALNGTTVLNTIALFKGADILRVHDVKEAMEAVTLVNYYHDEYYAG
jgi:dihydropteroate synthase